MRDEKEEKEASKVKQTNKAKQHSTPHVHVQCTCLLLHRNKQGQTNNKAEEHSIPKAVTFHKKNELPRVGLEQYVAPESMQHTS